MWKIEQHNDTEMTDVYITQMKELIKAPRKFFDLKLTTSLAYSLRKLSMKNEKVMLLFLLPSLVFATGGANS